MPFTVNRARHEVSVNCVLISSAKIGQRSNLAWRYGLLQDRLIRNESKVEAVFTPAVHAKSCAPAHRTAPPCAWTT
jgi:hypothetical protein